MSSAGDNRLEAILEQATNESSNLQTLNLSKNFLAYVDVSRLVNLTTLNLDNNRLSEIYGLESLKHLTTLSWREQNLQHAYPGTSIQYSDCDELRNLHLSGNTLSHFAPTVEFLNLNYLELASCGLCRLGTDFGLKMPNLRILNLNFNALKDIRPLLGIAKLEELHLAGNRVSRLRRTMSVLSRGCKSLSRLDLRSNPMTVGFYAPPCAQDTTGSDERRMVIKEQTRGDIDENSDDATAHRYLLPLRDQEADATYLERLDEDTKLRRRVYEIMASSACKTLERLDGTSVRSRKVLKRDVVWERLVELNVLKEKAKGARDDYEGYDQALD